MNTLRYMVLFGLTFLVGVSHLEAQGGQAFSKGPLSASVAAKAIETEDSTKFNVAIDSIVVATNLMFGLRLEHRQDLANYIRTLSQYPCEEVARGREIPFARVIGELIDLSGVWQRNCRSNEHLLCDDQLGKCFFSDWCWNLLVGRLAPPEKVAESPTLVQEPVQEQVLFPVSTVFSDTVFVKMVGEFTTPPVLVPASASRRGGWLSHNWGYPVGGVAIAVATGAIYCLFISDDGCFHIRQTQTTNIY